MSVSLVFITYRPGGIDILADSLQNQTFKDYELNRRDKVKRYLKRKGIPVSYVGPSKPKCFPDVSFNALNATNTGFLLSTKEIVVKFDDYQWFPPDWLEKIARHSKLFEENYCVVLPGQMWENSRPRNDKGLISVWKRHWKGSPEENGCSKSFTWVPEGFELACTAFPWKLLAAMNGVPECLDAFAAHPLEPLLKRFNTAGGKVYVDRENFMHIIDHRQWQPAELWHQAKRKGAGSTIYLERENCFDLKTHIRGKAYWLEGANIFEKPEYWCGDLGYRPGPDSIGYRDFAINQVKVDYILSRKPGRVLDIGCGFGYIVERLRKSGVDAYGIDVSNYALSQAPDEVKPYLKFASANSLPFGDKEFDIAFSASVFEHLPPEILQKAISEAVRVAKRGIIAVTPGDDPHFDEDITHQTKQPLSWWRDQFPPEFETLNDADEEWVKLQAKISEMVKINLGSFVDVIPGWENVDILPLRQQIPPEVKFRQWDLRRGIPWQADNSVDLYRMSHLLEHLTLSEAKNLLSEIYRTLKSGGLARISTPDLDLLLRHYRNRDMSAFNVIQFSGDYSHKAIYSFEMLKNFLEQAGFQLSKIYRVSPGFSYSDTMKNETEDQHEIVSLNIEALK